MADICGILFNIQRFSIHDGPGIRTTVFFKGCPLRCFWCHNPEGLHKKVDIQFSSSRCIGCGECVQICAEEAQELIIHPDGQFERIFHRERCTACGKCVVNCFAESLEQVGKPVSVGNVMNEILQDRGFYGALGGVTLSGGEPMLQPAFALEILAQCKAQGIHTALETSTFYHWETLSAALPLTDLFMIDIKHMDSAKHRQATGVPNEQILANIRRLAQTGKPVIFRTPIIPSVNDTSKAISAIACFIRELAETPLVDGTLHPERFSMELLAFHKLASDKYKSLGIDYPAAALEPPTTEHMTELAQAAAAAADNGITVRIR